MIDPFGEIVVGLICTAVFIGFLILAVTTD